MGDQAYFHQVGPFFSGLTAMSGMQVYHYAAGGTTSKAIWTDYEKSATGSQPLDADAYGVADFYGDGLYRLVVVDPNSTTIFDWDGVQIGPVQPVEVSVHKNGTDQVSAATGTWTKVTFGTETYDAAGTYASNKWTPARTGRALVTAGVTFSSIASAASMVLGVYVNSSVVKQTQVLADSAISGLYGIDVAAMVNVASTTDFIELYVNHDSGADAEIVGEAEATWFQGCLIA